MGEAKISSKLKEACKALKKAQSEHKENRDTNLKQVIKTKEKEAQESNDPKAAQKAAKAAETVLCKHRTQKSYTRIKYIFKPGLGGGLQ
jgi:hypothetical protein